MKEAKMYVCVVLYVRMRVLYCIVFMHVLYVCMDVYIVCILYVCMHVCIYCMYVLYSSDINYSTFQNPNNKKKFQFTFQCNLLIVTNAIDEFINFETMIIIKHVILGVTMQCNALDECICLIIKIN